MGGRGSDCAKNSQKDEQKLTEGYSGGRLRWGTGGRGYVNGDDVAISYLETLELDGENLLEELLKDSL